jgi:hypothetical protein
VPLQLAAFEEFFNALPNSDQRIITARLPEGVAHLF